MKRIVLYLMLGSAFLAMVLMVATGESVSGRPRKERESRQTRINKRAQDARNGDRAAIQALANETFDPADLGLGDIPEEAVEAIKNRLVKAEMDYRAGNGKQKAIEERDVARMINNLADTLQLPDYAKTNSFQVRHLRLGVWPNLLKFIAQEDAKERANPHVRMGLKITTKMSPLEGAYVAVLMLQQKNQNAAFQITPKQESLFVYNLKLERWTAHRNGKNLENQKPPQLKLLGQDNPKVREMRQAVSNGLTSLAPTELKNLPSNLLDSLGIEGREK